MVGNKHKNGIICTFPNCNRPMRTQKFKMHFTRAHLKDGEVYSVEHRRQYEVAREENVITSVKSEPAAAAPTMPTATTTTTVEEITRVEAMIPATAPAPAASSAHKDTQATEARQEASVLPSHTEASVASVARSDDGAANASESPSTIQVTTTVPTSAQNLLLGEQTSGSKRPAAAMETSTEAVDPSSVLLMQFIALMDQRFQELVAKMGEMIDVQKDLIDTLQVSNPNGQAPASAFSHAVKVVMKRRKKDISGNGNADATGGGQDNGFAL